MNLMGVQMIVILTILKTEFCRVEQVRAKVKTTANSMTAKTLRQVTCQTVQPQKDCQRGKVRNLWTSQLSRFYAPKSKIL